jgi:hypothetical protein
MKATIEKTLSEKFFFEDGRTEIEFDFGNDKTALAYIDVELNYHVTSKQTYYQPEEGYETIESAQCYEVYGDDGVDEEEVKELINEWLDENRG